MRLGQCKKSSSQPQLLKRSKSR